MDDIADVHFEIDIKSQRKIAICIAVGTDKLLTLRKAYQVLPDESADRSNYIRITDDEGEEYLNQSKYFALIPVSQSVETAILQAV